MSGDQIKQMMARHERQLGQCFEREMQRNPRLNGRLVFQVTIGPDGRVVQADIEEDELNNSAVANCSRTRLMRLLFPTPKGGGIARVSLPVVFGPNQ
ncbi:MAG: AgmX/PglI C-terminal domain-containing protein [Myxococcota bacterium]